MSEDQVQNEARRTLQGVVVSDKMDKTITVEIERLVKHPLYGKVMRRRSKLHAHDEANTAKQGDTVRITECRPISRSKSWRLVDIVTSAVTA